MGVDATSSPSAASTKGYVTPGFSRPKISEAREAASKITCLVASFIRLKNIEY